MQHKGLGRLTLERINPLFSIGSAECHDCKALCLSPDEKGGAMGPWENAHFRTDRPDLVRLPAVGPYVVMQNHVPDQALLYFIKDRGYLPRSVVLFSVYLCNDLFQNRI